MSMILPNVNLISLLPELLLLAGATVLLFIRGAGRGRGIFPVAVASVVASLAALAFFWDQGVRGFDGLITRDNGALLFQMMILIAALISWGIALFEYLIQVPANRIGHTSLSVGQLKIMQEVIALTVFVPFSVLYLKEQIKLDYLWAGLCILGAVFFVFREKLFAN